MRVPRLLRSRWFWVAALLLVTIVGVAAWLERGALLAWHHAYQLTATEDGDREHGLNVLAGGEVQAIRPLLWRLGSSDPAVCARAGNVLRELADRWKVTGGPCQELAAALARAFPELAEPGRQQALQVAERLLADHTGQAYLDAAEVLVIRGLESSGVEARTSALQLAASFLHRVPEPGSELMAWCRQAAEEGLSHRRAELRAAAVRLAAAPGVGLLDRLPPLLEDSAAEVRWLSLLAVGADEKLVPADDLIKFLHDSDADVRQVCEQALRSRGLGEVHLQLARSMSAPEPSVRAQVPAAVFDFPELDSKVWLDRLGKDPSPAVRAAVVRASVERAVAPDRIWLQQVAVTDGSPTVRQLANYYLSRGGAN